MYQLVAEIKLEEIANSYADDAIVDGYDAKLKG